MIKPDLQGPDLAEFEQLRQTLGERGAEHAMHIVFSRYTLSERDPRTQQFWRDVLQEMRDTVRVNTRH